MARVAFYTIGLLQVPVGNPRLADYERLTPPLFDHCFAAPGFVCLVDAGDIVRPQFAKTEGLFPVSTLSVWSELESVFAFSYHGIHGEAMRRRREWFHQPEQPTHVAWWIADGELPTWSAAVERHERLHVEGATPLAFSLRCAFDAAGTPYQIKKPERKSDRSSKSL